MKKDSAVDLFGGTSELLTIAEASTWASQKTGTNITKANIDYLIKHGRIPAHQNQRTRLVAVADLYAYYESKNYRRETNYKARLGDDLMWELSFDQFKEAETTKHVHRLHPYKGKFIPQLVQYFLDDHLDNYKTETWFKPGDVVLDPFCGSGTTLVEANERGLHAIGIDVSAFNAYMSNVKVSNIDLMALANATKKVRDVISRNASGVVAREFEAELSERLSSFNKEFFPAPAFRYQVRQGQVDEEEFGARKACVFHELFVELLHKHGVNNSLSSSKEDFLARWVLPSVRAEIEVALETIEGFDNSDLKNVLRLILSRTVRSSRATKHYDLATLVSPQSVPYYCSKHSKVCRPLFSMLGWWNRYSNDTLRRLSEFAIIRTNTHQICLHGDSRTVNVPNVLKNQCPELSEILTRRGITGIFSSPPYVGLIDYHEQHAYSYKLFGIPREDNNEIGSLKTGSGKQAQISYIDGISSVLRNCLKFLNPDCNVFLVANDKFSLYDQIASMAKLKIVKEYRRPVLNRAEGNKGVYAESIFHMKRDLL